jgi:hypothetical protein
MYAGTACAAGGRLDTNDLFGRRAIPAGVIRPSFTSFANLRRFESDHWLFSFRGVNLWAYRFSSIGLVIPSIQPKHSASSTASSYATRGRPVFFLL